MNLDEFTFEFEIKRNWKTMPLVDSVQKVIYKTFGFIKNLQENMFYLM